MPQQKIVFLDRDGTLIEEPEDRQVDSLEKLIYIPNVVPALLRLQRAGYVFVMVTNQTGLGLASFPQESFDVPHEVMMQHFLSHGIHFEAVRVCPHTAADNCECRKPKIGLVLDYLAADKIDRTKSYVVGDRKTDIEFAENIGVRGIQIGNNLSWNIIVDMILKSNSGE